MAQSLPGSKSYQANATNRVNSDGPPSWTVAQKAWSALLVVVTLLLGVACVLMLSCTLTQTRMSTIALSGANLSIWKLNDIREKWQELRDEIKLQTRYLAQDERDKIDAEARSSAFDVQYKPKRTALDAKLGRFIAHLREHEPSLATAMESEGPVERLETIESQRDRLIKAQPDLEDSIKDILRLSSVYKELDAERISVRAQKQSHEDIARAAAQRLAASQEALDNLFSSQLGVKPIDPPTRVRIENALFELYSGKYIGPVINSMLILPPEILTLFLVVLMGILGSSLQLTHQLFIRKEAESLGVYSLRLSVGAITALVIFIVAKAGVPVIADASKFGGETPINPYFVSFLAIISGLMSEKAIASVQTQAAKYFDSGASETLRWTRAEVQDGVTQSQRNRPDLARNLDVSETALQAWLSGDEPVPVAGQKLFAAILNRPIRDLFTDIPPDRKPRPPEPAPSQTDGLQEPAADAGKPPEAATPAAAPQDPGGTEKPTGGANG